MKEPENDVCFGLPGVVIGKAVFTLRRKHGVSRRIALVCAGQVEGNGWENRRYIADLCLLEHYERDHRPRWRRCF